MNKRVAKPKDDEPLLPDDDVTEAQMDQYLRDHHDEIAEKLRAGKADVDRGDVVEVNSLEEFLALVRKPARDAKQS
jgi:hypothetical protein